MSTSADGRAGLMDRLQAEMVQTVAAGMLFHQAVADRVGLSLSELKCFTLVTSGIDVTAGDIAHGTGLTTGAVTRMVDRLAARGWVRREPDPGDRRRILVRPTPGRDGDLGPLYGGMAHAWGEALSEYDDEQIGLLLELFTRMRAVAHEQAARLGADGAGGTENRRASGVRPRRPPPSAAARPPPRPA